MIVPEAFALLGITPVHYVDCAGVMLFRGEEHICDIALYVQPEEVTAEAIAMWEKTPPLRKYTLAESECVSGPGSEPGKYHTWHERNARDPDTRTHIERKMGIPWHEGTLAR